MAFPGRAHYGDYPQIEDGEEWAPFAVEAKKLTTRYWLFRTQPDAPAGCDWRMFYPILARYADEIMKKRTCSGRGDQIISSFFARKYRGRAMREVTFWRPEFFEESSSFQSRLA